MRGACLLLVPLLTVGCLREAPPAAPPRAPVAAPGYGWPPPVVGLDTPAPAWAQAAPVLYEPTSEPASGALAPTPDRTAKTERAPAPATKPDAMVPAVPTGPSPAGAACLERLKTLGIAHAPLDARRGVSTPVQVKGDLGGVKFVAGAGLPLEVDCRLAVTLYELAPISKALGIDAWRFSGAYVYRNSKVGRLSLHAHGLALDVHAVHVDGAWLTVEQHFTRGLSDDPGKSLTRGGCASDAPVLNRLACELKRTGRFQELLTPDYNADHHDHLHLAIPKTGDEPADTDAGAGAATERTKARP